MKTEMLLSSIIFKIQEKVSSRAPHAPQNFILGEKIIQKMPNFRNLG